MPHETMIERVGRTIESKWNSLQDLPPIELTAEEAGELGRAAIEAMRIDALERENARLREALKPFSSVTEKAFERWFFGNEKKGPVPSKTVILSAQGCMITVSDFRCAQRTIAMIDAALNEKAAADP